MKRKKKPTFYRRTISISADLQKRMDREGDVNWSRVAAVAFEAKLAEIAATKLVEAEFSSSDVDYQFV